MKEVYIGIGKFENLPRRRRVASGAHTLRKICKAKNGHPGVPSGARTLPKGGEEGPMGWRGEANSPLIPLCYTYSLHYSAHRAICSAAATAKVLYWRIYTSILYALSVSLTLRGLPPRVSCVQGEQRLQESIRVRSRRRSHRPTATSCALRPCATNAVCGHTDYQSVLVSVREKNQSEYNTELGSLEPQRPAGAFRSRSYRLQRATTHVDPGRRRVTDDNRPCAAAAAQLIAADTSTTPIRLATSHHKSVAELRF